MAVGVLALDKHIAAGHTGKVLLIGVKFVVMLLYVAKVVGNNGAEVVFRLGIVAVHLGANAAVSLVLGIPTSACVSVLFGCAPFEALDVVLGAFLSRRVAEPNKGEQLVQKVEVAHKVMLHLQLHWNAQPQLHQFYKHIAEGLYHRVGIGFAHYVSGAEIVTANHINGNILVSPSLGGVAAQSHVVHRYFAEAECAVFAAVFGSECVLIVEMSVAVGVNGGVIIVAVKYAPNGAV